MRGAVVFSYAEGGVAVLPQDFGGGAVLHWEVGVVTGGAVLVVVETAHVAVVVVAAGQEAGAGGGADGGRVEVVEPQSVLGEVVEGRRLDESAEGRTGAEARIIQEDPDDVRRSGPGDGVVAGIGGLRFGYGLADLAREGRVGAVLRGGGWRGKHGAPGREAGQEKGWVALHGRWIEGYIFPCSPRWLSLNPRK